MYTMYRYVVIICRRIVAVCIIKTNGCQVTDIYSIQGTGYRSVGDSTVELTTLPPLGQEFSYREDF